MLCGAVFSSWRCAIYWSYSRFKFMSVQLDKRIIIMMSRYQNLSHFEILGWKAIGHMAFFFLFLFLKSSNTITLFWWWNLFKFLSHLIQNERRGNVYNVKKKTFYKISIYITWDTESRVQRLEYQSFDTNHALKSIWSYSGTRGALCSLGALVCCVLGTAYEFCCMLHLWQLNLISKFTDVANDSHQNL